MLVLGFAVFKGQMGEVKNIQVQGKALRVLDSRSQKLVWALLGG